MDTLVAETAQRIFADHQDDADSLWQEMEANGLTQAWVPERFGGSDLSVADGLGLIRLAATVNVGVPFAETLLASFALSAAGIETPPGPLTVCTSNNRVTSVLPYGDVARFALRLNGDQVQCFETSALRAISSVGYDQVAEIDFANRQPVLSAVLTDWMSLEVFTQLGALVRSAQICGAMDKVLDLTLEHTSTREQFGRPLAKFQAIQHLLADIAGEIAASSAALEAAIPTVSQSTAPDRVAVACAKSRASEAAGIVAANAHQAHGAIGYTEEYLLARFTRRLWQWREDFENETHWNMVLGDYYTRETSRSLKQDLLGST